MKRIQLLLIFAFMLGTVGFAQITVPSPSPAASVYTRVGLTDVTIDYFRPKVRGRKIFGSDDAALLAYGALWRTGAGDGAVVTFSTDVTMKNQSIKAGKYLILTIPDDKDWTFILYKDLNIDGANLSGNFKEEEVAFKTKVTAYKTKEEVQSLSFQISNISDDNTSANIEFAWANVGFKVPFQVVFDDVVMDDIAAKTVVEPINYIKAARYYLEYDKDLEQALTWVNTYLEMEGHDTHFWYMYLKVQILAKMNRKNEAIDVAEKSIALAKKSARGDLGYIKRNQAIIDSFE
ncbi:DUF2911 domain-containing protein [Mangrovimonas futianensis]|uniref:DUF2911 domain-containing protein n=1 Tax=Mangrovimonas futianensis TaxID=2895523 RepID=UPI001E41EB80|nr:DUF2911 domain-containing protein [Mangrovimonas futianensis]MCF1422904.1 DUF2911 domain-containing protein [Mangrovimonas futianensis]